MTIEEKTEILRRVYHRKVALRSYNDSKLSFEDWLRAQHYRAIGSIMAQMRALDYDFIRPKKRAHAKKLLRATANYQAVVQEILAKGVTE